MEELKQKIREEIEEFRSAKTREDKQKVMISRKEDTNSFREDFIKKYESRIDKNQKLIKFDINHFEPYIEFCETKEQTEMWNYFRIKVSSLTYTGYYGRSIRYFLRDRVSGEIFGVVGIGSDFMGLGPRDSYIGWNKKEKFGKTLNKDGTEYGKSVSSWKEQKALELIKQDNKINNLMNIFVCISVPPYNDLLMGKLCVMSAFSDEVRDYFEKKYNQKLAGITTTSIYGKSIQYDRMNNFLRFLGLSKGMGTVQFSKTTIEKIRDYYIQNQENKGWKSASDLGLQPKAKMIIIVCKDMGFKSDILKHEHYRGIYFGYTFQNSKEFLNGKIKENELISFPDRNFKSLVDFWRIRWFVKNKYTEENKNDESKGID